MCNIKAYNVWGGVVETPPRNLDEGIDSEVGYWDIFLERAEIEKPESEEAALNWVRTLLEACYVPLPYLLCFSLLEGLGQEMHCGHFWMIFRG